MAKRSARPWSRVRAQVLKHAQVCAICGKWMDLSLPGTHPMGPSVNHRVPLAHGGHPYALSNLEPCHMICNSRLGARPKHRVTTKRSRVW